MKHLSLDIETLSLRPNAAIIQIGATFFSPENDSVTTFNSGISVASNFLRQRHFSQATIDFWYKQDQQLFGKLLESQQDIYNILHSLLTWIQTETNREEYRLWTRGTLDVVTLTDAYESCNIQLPWEHRWWRDERTIVKLGIPVVVEENTTKHDALQDAIHQAKILRATFQVLEEKGIPIWTA